MSAELDLGTTTIVSVISTLSFGSSTGYRAIWENGIFTADRRYYIPDVGASASMVMTEGNQTINGNKIFSSLCSTSIKINYDGSNYHTFTGAPTAVRSHTLQDVDGTVAHTDDLIIYTRGSPSGYTATVNIGSFIADTINEVVFYANIVSGGSASLKITTLGGTTVCNVSYSGNNTTTKYIITSFSNLSSTMYNITWNTGDSLIFHKLYAIYVK